MRQCDLKNISILYSFCQIFVRALKHISTPFITDIVRKQHDFFWKTNTAEVVWPSLNRGDRGDQVYSLLGLIFLSAGDLFRPLSSQGCGVNGEWERAVSIKISQRNACFAFHNPSLVWDLDEKVRKLPDLTDKTDVFLSEGKCKPHLRLASEHTPIFKSFSKSAVRKQTSWKRNLFLFLFVVFLGNKH